MLENIIHFKIKIINGIKIMALEIVDKKNRCFLTEKLEKITPLFSISLFSDDIEQFDWEITQVFATTLLNTAWPLWFLEMRK
jgi:hypothetical protein